MATLDTLPGDQRAVVQLVLGRGRSYGEIARLLTINPDAVRERARAAADALGPQTAVPAANRQVICDYLLGQLPDHDVPAVRELLAHAAGERAWAHGVSEQLASVSAQPLPEIPGDGGTPVAPMAPMAPAPAPVTPPAPAEATSPPDPAPTADVVSGEPTSRRRGLRRGRTPKTPKTLKEPAPSPQAPKPSRAERRAAAADGSPRSSRRGGVVVIAVTVIVIAAVLIIIAKHHSHASVTAASSSVTQTNPASATQTSTSASTTSGESSSGAKVITQINLLPSTAGAKAAAIADVLQEGSVREVAIVGQNVPANTKHNSYEVWLYNSQSDAVSLGFVDPGVSANGKLSAAGPLPANASSYRRLVVTTETVAHPKAPGPIVLAGTITGL